MTDRVTGDLYAYCKHCGRVIVFDDWCFIHFDGWANCRSKENMALLDDLTHCEPDPTCPIDPQPASDDEARGLPVRGWMGEELRAKAAGNPGPAVVSAALTTGDILSINALAPEGDPA